MDSSQEDEYYPILRLFPTKYGILDISKATYNPEHRSLCNLVGSQNLDNHSAFIYDCTKVATYIKDLYTKRPIKGKTELCKFMNYSVNYAVKKNKIRNYSEEQLIKAYNKLAANLGECNDSIKVIEERVLKNIEELSKIYYNFNKYINGINENRDTDCKDVSHSVELYLSYEDRCNGATDKFCVAVDNFKNYYLSKISQVKCEDVEHTLKSFLSLGNTEAVSFEEEAEEGRQDSPKEVGVVREEAMSTVTLNQEDSPEMGNTKSTITTTFSTIFALASTFFITYKFTPLGTWIRPLVQRKNKKTISMYDEALRFNNNSSIQTNDSGNTEFNLQYHSS